MPIASTTESASTEPEPEEQPPSRARHGTAGLSAARAEIVIDPDPAVAPRADIDWLHARLMELLPHLPRPVARLDIRLVDDAAMVRLHEEHLDDPTTTDVLTFDLSEDAEGEAIEASIVLCVDEAARQAAERGHTVERELLLYALHGLLHCAGHDDHDPAAHARMHAEEDRLLMLIGVGATFGESGDRPGRGVSS